MLQVVVVHFEPEIVPKEGLISVFMVREDGHTVKRCGSVVGGVLLHGKHKQPF